MVSFIEETLEKLLERESFRLEETTFVLPSIRSDNYLKHCLHQKTNSTVFAPEVVSIEELIEQITRLKLLDNTQTLFRFYQVYKDHINQNESFDTFYGWARTLVYDFNEIDRFLIDSDAFFKYLSEVQSIQQWSLSKPQTEIIKNYLKFWQSVPLLYKKLKTNLLQDEEAYQGLMYRKAAENIESFLENTNQQYIFLGFNALNEAEKKILNSALETKKGEVFWDLDNAFLLNKSHEASLFLRGYFSEWKYYQENKIPTLAENYISPKKVESIGIPKNVGQAKYVAQILENIPQEELSKTALILSDEALLAPILNSLPNHIQKVNVTMGLPLRYTPMASLFESIFNFQLQQQKELYYKQVLQILNHPFVAKILENESQQISKKINSENLVYFSRDQFWELSDSKTKKLLEPVFNRIEEPIHFLNVLIELTLELKNEEKNNNLETAYLFQFNQLFLKLKKLINEYKSIESISSLFNLYKDSLTNEQLDFSGSPFDGLQIMGMLESRVLDFENVIITSVNEGIIPAGKSTNSYIPYDLKVEYKLPTYKEKDAIYTYHFYHLLQRAKRVHLLYNTETGSLGAGEKSRFLTQLQVERPDAMEWKESFVNPKVTSLTKPLKEIEKTPEIIEKLKKHANSGFSPSALTTYIRNPLDFYIQYILGIRETDEIEETVAANTLGTVVHDSLEKLFKPFEGLQVQQEDLQQMKKKVDALVTSEFKETYKKAPINKGKNLITFEVAKRYIHNFLNLELQQISSNEIFIQQIEETKKIEVLKNRFDFPIYLKGKVDRVDSLNGKTRIIDYKTGKVEKKHLTLKNWEDLTTDYEFSKAFQVLCYARMIPELDNAEAGIISFKNLKEDFIPLRVSQDTTVNQELMVNFEAQLEELIKEIFDPNIPFKEKEV